VLANISVIVGQTSNIIVAGDVIVDGNLTIYLQSSSLSFNISGCLKSDSIDLYLPTTSTGDFMVLNQNSSCAIPKFNVISSYSGDCVNLKEEHQNYKDKVLISFQYINTCNTNDPLPIILGVVLGLIFLVCLWAGYVIRRDKVKVLAQVNNLIDKMPDFNRSQEKIMR